MIAALLTLSLAATPEPPARAYALSIGNNSVPEGAVGLERLRYADDDALRFHGLFARASMQATLLTVADADSQRRYPEATAASSPPTEAQLERAVTALEKDLRRDRDAGVRTTAYLFFSGHGGVNDQGEPYLALLDGQLTRTRLFRDVLDRLPADRVHVIIDACNAGAVVGLRGPFDEAREASRAPLDDAELSSLAAADRLERYPHVGFLVAAATGRAAHEWSRLESGVFSHEVYSALIGAGDVNGDELVEYSEVEAFVSAANAGLENARAHLSIRTHAPAAHRRSPLFALRWLGDGPFLSGRTQTAMRLYLERGDGQRICDLHLGAGMRFKLALPVDAVAFVRTRQREARLDPREAGVVRFEGLELGERGTTERGALDDALQTGLFAEPFSESYYRGYANSRGLNAVPMPRIAAAAETTYEEPDPRGPLIVAAWVGSAAALGVGLVTGGLALERRSAFSNAPTQREAADIAEVYERNRDVAVGSFAAAGALAALALVLDLTRDHPDGPVATVGPDGEGWRAMAGWSTRF